MANPFSGSRHAGAFHVGSIAGAARTFLGAGLARPLGPGNAWLATDVVAKSQQPVSSEVSKPAPPAFPPRRP